MRPTAEKRHLDYTKAVRKRKIDRDLSAARLYSKDWYNNLHQYSKNKIHCSCPMCSEKTNNRGYYGPAMNWKPSDKRKIDSLNYKEEEV